MGVITDWKRGVPRCKSPFNLLFFLTNCIWPSFGTMLAACLNEDNEFRQKQMWIGVAQWLLVFVLIGWFWSIWWGFLIYKKGK